MAGGFKVFGPTYNSTKYVRFGHEGTINSLHNIDPALIPTSNNVGVEELAGKIAMITSCTVDKTVDDSHVIVRDGVEVDCPEGYATLCTDASKAVGLFVDDLGDIVGGSGKASFYFRGGEYYISVARMGEGATEIKAGDSLTCDGGGKLIKGDSNVIAIATTAPVVFTTGNMYENAGTEANGGLFVGISLKM